MKTLHAIPVSERPATSGFYPVKTEKEYWFGMCYFNAMTENWDQKIQCWFSETSPQQGEVKTALNVLRKHEKTNNGDLTGWQEDWVITAMMEYASQFQHQPSGEVENKNHEQYMSDGDHWFHGNLIALITSEAMLVREGKQPSIDKKGIAEWVSKHAYKSTPSPDLEQAANAYMHKKGDIPSTDLENEIAKLGFIEGAKWQAQHQPAFVLPDDDFIEANGKEGGLKDNELQLYWEGAVWMRNELKSRGVVDVVDFLKWFHKKWNYSRTGESYRRWYCDITKKEYTHEQLLNEYLNSQQNKG